MQTVVIYSPSAITTEMWKQFVAELGGEWRVWDGYEDGYVSDGQNSLLLEQTMRVERELLDDEEWAEIVRQLGCEPQSQISLQLFSSPEKRAFAEYVAGEVVRRWGGLIQGLD